MRKAAEVEKRIDARMQGAVRQSEEAMLRAEEVRRRIETGDVHPRPLPSLREDSIPSMKSMESMESTRSAKLRDKRLASADYGEDYGKGKDYGKDYGKAKDYDQDY